MTEDSGRLKGWARSKARRILHDYMAKPGATLECDIFEPTVEALMAAYRTGHDTATREFIGLPRSKK